METKDLKEIGFKIGSLKTITKDNLNVKQKIVYQKLPHYKESYVYAFLENLNTFYFGDKNDSEFFTLTVKSIQQIQDLLKALDFEKYDAEKFVLETIEGVEPKKLSNGDDEWYKEWCKDGNWLFTQDFKNGVLLVSYSNIRLVLNKEFGLNNNEMKELLTKVLHNYTDNGKLEVVFY